MKGHIQAKKGHIVKRIGFLLLDGFAMMSTAAAMEPLRAANLFSQSALYDIVVLSQHGGPVSSTLPGLFTTQAISEVPQTFDLVFVVAGGDPLNARAPRVFDWLRQLDRNGVPLGGISGGAAILARAGLMEKRRFTIHWHHIDAMREASAGYLIERRLYLIDRDRYTCAGGTAPLDMMHAIIAADHGTRFARKIADWFIQTEIRQPGDPQQANIEARYGVLPAPVAEAIELMESHIADPLNLQQLADLVAMSRRQLQRHFKSVFNQSVMETYRDIRLDLAKDLLIGTQVTLNEVADMAGFSTSGTFSTAYKRKFGHAPRTDRALKES